MTKLGRILIADDEETFVNSMADLLRREGYECGCAPNAIVAAELLRSNDYDLLIADIKMEGNFELELIQDLPQIAAGMPVILVTGYPSLKSAIQSVQLPVVAYLVKPFEFKELLEQVEKSIKDHLFFKPVCNIKKEKNISNLRDLISEFVRKMNSLLASMIGHTQLLVIKMMDPEAKEDLGKVIEEAERVSQMVKDLVNHMRKWRPRKEVVNLNDLIERTLEGKALKLSWKNIRLVEELASSLPSTLADPKQIRQVLLCLIDNAEEAITESHGFGEIRVGTHVMDGQIEVVVSDDGPGITEENLPRVFDPFFTTKGKVTGLGLSISYDMIIQHGGTLRVESEWGKGETFIISLPINQIKGEKKIDREKCVERNFGRLKGLVIDDDLRIINLLSKYLNKEGYEMETAAEVKTALSIIEGKDFDFVICDIKMPEMGGDDFYRVVKEKRPSLADRIIFLTGDTLGDETRTFIDSVTNPLIEKPFELSGLKEEIVKVISYDGSSPLPGQAGA
jgi:two-component system NtrC family sensor kinase